LLPGAIIGQACWASTCVTGLGVLMFALLIHLATIYDIDWLKPRLAAIGIA